MIYLNDISSKQIAEFARTKGAKDKKPRERRSRGNFIIPIGLAGATAGTGYGTYKTGKRAVNDLKKLNTDQILNEFQPAGKRNWGQILDDVNKVVRKKQPFADSKTLQNIAKKAREVGLKKVAPKVAVPLALGVSTLGLAGATTGATGQYLFERFNAARADKKRRMGK